MNNHFTELTTVVLENISGGMMWQHNPGFVGGRVIGMPKYSGGGFYFN
jgi:hypothetical protein